MSASSCSFSNTPSGGMQPTSAQTPAMVPAGHRRVRVIARADAEVLHEDGGDQGPDNTKTCEVMTGEDQPRALRAGRLPVRAATRQQIRQVTSPGS